MVRDLFSLNGYVGRHAWEWDPNAGTKSEREAVDRARASSPNTDMRSNTPPTSSCACSSTRCAARGREIEPDLRLHSAYVNPPAPTPRQP